MSAYQCKEGCPLVRRYEKSSKEIVCSFVFSHITQDCPCVGCLVRPTCRDICPDFEKVFVLHKDGLIDRNHNNGT